MAVNGFGALCTFLVMMIFAITKFQDGAYVVIFIIPALVVMFTIINRHYLSLAGKLSLDRYGSPPPRIHRNRVLLPIGGVHRGTLAALRYAHTLEDITAVHISINPEESERRINGSSGGWSSPRSLNPLAPPIHGTLVDYIDEIYKNANQTK
jgi:hypothetical protein